MGGWIGVDLDGTLAHYTAWTNGQIGQPVPAMVERVKQWLSEDKDVRVFTARVSIDPSLYSSESLRCADAQFAAEQRALIEAWCLQHIGVVLPVTATKDFTMLELWDDRAVTVEMNTGRVLTVRGSAAQ